MIKQVPRNKARKVRHVRVRKNIVGTTDVPRLNVYRSSKNITAQIINDETKHTLVSASSLTLKEAGNNIKGAELVGKEVAKLAKKAGVTKVVFDRGGYLYHGRVKALAEAARAEGLEF